jgi:predicted ester cyclase
MKAKIIFNSLKLLMLVSFFSFSCVNSKITSNKAPDFNEKIVRLYLVIKNSKGAKEFSYSFKTAFLHGLSAKQIVSDYYVMDELALESDKDINEKISKFNPQVLMIMTQTESKGYREVNFGGSNNISGGIFDIKIMLPKSDKVIWRANLEAYGDTGIDAAVEKAAKKLLDKLIIDKLI